MLLLNNKIIPRDLIENFEEEIKSEKIKFLRVMATLGIVLYLSFSVADIWALSTALVHIYLIRAVVVAVLALSFVLTFYPVFIKHYQSIVPIPYLFASFGIEAMIFLSTPEDSASRIYFSGLILVIMILFSWSHLKLTNLIATTTVIISMYAVVEASKYNYNLTTLLPILIPNLLFLSSAAIIGAVTQYFRDRYVQENFILQRRLEKSLEDKTEEANDNAYLANHDALTGLANRRYATEKLEIALQIAKEKDKVLIIMFVDLNGFKQINDVYGHAIGDDVLRITARRLELAVRDSDCLSRLGGDEFLIGLLIDKENVSEVESMIEKYTTIITDPIKTEGVKLQIGASIGVAAYPIHGNNVSVLLDIADKKMYEIKRGNHKTNKQLDLDDSQAVVIFSGKRKQEKYLG